MKNILRSLLGLLLLVFGVFSLLACCTYHATDPSWNTASTANPQNLWGYTGSCTADLLIQLFGCFAILIPIECILLSFMLFYKARWTFVRFCLFVTALLCGCLLLSDTASAITQSLSQTTFSFFKPLLMGGFVGFYLTQFMPVPTGFLYGLLWVIVICFFVLSLRIPLIKILKWSHSRVVKTTPNLKLPQSALSALESVVPSTPILAPVVQPSVEETSILSDVVPAEDTLVFDAPKKKLFSLFKKKKKEVLPRVEPSFESFGGVDPLFRSAGAVKQAETETEQQESSSFLGSKTLAGVASSVMTGAASVVSNTFNSKPEVSKTQKEVKQVVPQMPQPADVLQLPTSDLLDPIQASTGTALTKEAMDVVAKNLERVLSEFRISGHVIGAHPGPVVTLYEFQAAAGIRANRIISLSDDIAMRMEAKHVRIANIPGTNAIGIEIPNKKREIVYIREMVEHANFRKNTGILPMILGKDIGGTPILADLAKMPHLLVAGTTGSGKSVAINAMVLSLLYRFTPAQCRLIMVDPKIVELSVYNRIPHLLTPVVTEPAKAVMALKWAVREMDDRYRSMAHLGVRNIESYNQKLVQAAQEGRSLTRRVQTGFDPQTGSPIFEEQEFDLTPLPYIVIIVDEMADLMGQCGKEVDPLIQRLAQKSRAVGIHLILATQRPSVDVITGVIKSNFPSRISFQVRSRIDSRTILDEQGAEQLLGKGDMLFMPAGQDPQRIHGPLVSDEDVERVVHHWELQAEPQYLDAVTADVDGSGSTASMGGADSDGDIDSGADLYDQAVAIVLRDRKPTISYIQRQLRIGYNRAADLIDKMEREGIISKQNVAGKREILVPTDNA